MGKQFLKMIFCSFLIIVVLPSGCDKEEKLKEWTRVVIDTNKNFTDGAHNIRPYDIDGDGILELIANSYRAGSLQFYKFIGDPKNSTDWQRYVIDNKVTYSSDFTSAHYTAIADINGDSRSDLIVAGDLGYEDVISYLAPEDRTDLSAWKKHILYDDGDPGQRTYHLEVGDIDGDGDQDVVIATKTDNDVGWLENNGTNDNWPITWIDNECAGCFNVRVADLDKDGQSDVIASARDQNEMVWYRYSGDPKRQVSWTKYTLASFDMLCPTVFEISDMNNDNAPDVIVALFSPYKKPVELHKLGIYLLKNPYLENVTQPWSKFRISRGFAARELDVGDIDRDGDLDIVAADQEKDLVVWFENPAKTSSEILENWIVHTVASENYLDWCHAVELGDIDGDGDLDIAVGAAILDPPKGSYYGTFQWYYRNSQKLMIRDVDKHDFSK